MPTCASARLDLKGTHVRLLIVATLFVDQIHPDSGCTDIDECQYFRSGSANFTYLYPTFENLPGDEWSSKSYQPQACPPADACVNLFYKNELGFKCVPADQTYAAVIIGGHDWNKVSDVLKADLSRCDGAIPTFGTSNNYNHHRVTRIRHQYSRLKMLSSPSVTACYAEQTPSCVWWLDRKRGSSHGTE